MIKTRVIPVLLHRGPHLVKGRQFDSARVVGHALQAARIHQQRGVDELLVLNVSATTTGSGPDIAFSKELTSDCFMPLTIGGGVRTMDHVHDLLANGADKVAICTAAFNRPGLIEEAAKKFGAQAVTVAVDVKQGQVHTHCGQTNTSIDPVTYAKRMEDQGAGEILLTSIDRDGMMEGYDLELIRRVVGSVAIPVVAAGGCGDYGDMADAIVNGAHAVASGAMFQFDDATPQGASLYLHKQGFNTRLAA